MLGVRSRVSFRILPAMPAHGADDAAVLIIIMALLLQRFEELCSSLELLSLSGEECVPFWQLMSVL